MTAKTSTKTTAAKKAATRAPARKAPAKAPAKKAVTKAPVKATTAPAQKVGRVGAHILEALASQPKGTFMTVAQIRNHRSTVYGDAKPSAGAIQAALKRPQTLPAGVEAGAPAGTLGAMTTTRR